MTQYGFSNGKIIQNNGHDKSSTLVLERINGQWGKGTRHQRIVQRTYFMARSMVHVICCCKLQYLCHSLKIALLHGGEEFDCYLVTYQLVHKIWHTYNLQQSWTVLKWRMHNVCYGIVIMDQPVRSALIREMSYFKTVLRIPRLLVRSGDVWDRS